MKVGRNPEVMLNPLHDMWAPDYATATLEEDVERVRAARAAIGPDVRLAIDANNAWTPSVALQFMRRVADQNIYWLEEPVATDDIDGSAEVAHALDVPVAGYETETGLASFRDLIAQRAVDIVQPDVDLDRRHHRLPQSGGAGPGLRLAGRSPRLLVGGRGDRQHALHRLAAEWRLARVRPESQPPRSELFEEADRGRIGWHGALAGPARTWRDTESGDRGPVPLP